MTGFQDKNGVLHADDLPVPDIIAETGSPAYIYSAGKIEENFNRLQNAFEEILPGDKQPLIAFACKANSNLAIMSLMNRLGAGSDVVSGGELTRSTLAGIAPEKIVYSGVSKSIEEISTAIDLGIRQINVESGSELRRIAQIAEEKHKKANVTIRFNPDVDSEAHHKTTTARAEDKFGLLRKDVERLYEWAAGQKWLNIRGLHVHIGSQVTKVEHYRTSYERLADLAQTLIDKGLPMDTLDLGGGIGIVYRDENAPDIRHYAEIVRDTAGSLNVNLMVEPGRYLVGDAGILVSRLLYIKNNDGLHFAVLDAGMNDLMRPALYDAWHTVRTVREMTDAHESYDVVGPVCETGDTFGRNRKLPALEEGELMAIMCAGAYGAVMSTTYNTRPLIPEILVNGNQYAIVRKRQSVQDILEYETVPDWLNENTGTR